MSKFKRKLKQFIQPNEVQQDIFSIDFFALKQKGIKNIFFDVDNTLLERYREYPEWKVQKLIRELKEGYFTVVLLSNNSSAKRLIKVASFLEVPAIGLSFKPFPWIYKKITKRFHLKPENAVFIGDQLFMDVLGANLRGFYSIYVFPLGKELSLFRRVYIRIEQFIVKSVVANVNDASTETAEQV